MELLLSFRLDPEFVSAEHKAQSVDKKRGQKRAFGVHVEFTSTVLPSAKFPIGG